MPHEEEQSASLLKHSPPPSTSASGVSDIAGKTKHGNQIPPKPPSYREVFTYQSNINMLVYTLLALHSVAYDQVLPVFMHYPQRRSRSSNPNEELPFKFVGGFGTDSDSIGLLFLIYGVVGMFIQFFAFPPLARRWGVLNCLKFSSIMFPLAYLATPFTALLSTPMSQRVSIFAVMLFKC